MEAKKKGGKKILVVLLLVVIAALVGVIVYLLQPEEEEAGNDRGRAVVLTEDNVAEFESESAVEDGYYLVTMNTTWEFEDGKSESSNAYVANARENTRTVYFDVFLSDTGEKVYSSPYLPVGAELENIKLEKELPAGAYTAVVTYHLVDEEEKEIDEVSAEVQIHVQN